MSQVLVSRLRSLPGGLLGLLLLLWISAPGLHAFPAGQQTYYILGFDHQIQQILNLVDNGEGGGLIPNPPTGASSIVGITIPATNQVIIYDHGEDGYEEDYYNIPTSHLVSGGGTTEIWGDGNTANGVPPGDPGNDDILETSQVLTLDSSTAPNATGCSGTTDECEIIDLGRDFDDIRFGGEDVVFTAGQPINVVHVMFPANTTSNTVLGGTWEIFPVEAYAENLTYTVPVGVDSYNDNSGDDGPYENFKYAEIVVQSTADDNPVVVDNGDTTVSFLLQKGQSWCSLGLIGTATANGITVNENTTVTASKPIQVGLIGGGDGRLQTRFFNIIPTGLYASEYVAPVYSRTNGTDDAFADIIINNPNPVQITVLAEDSQGTKTILVPANRPASYQAATPTRFVPEGSSVRFTSDKLFWGIGVYDRGGNGVDGTGGDWGFALQPNGFLEKEVACPHGPGNRSMVDPAAGGSDAGSPIWVAPIDDTTTFTVDWNGDGTPDEIDIDNDGNGDGTSVTLDALEAEGLYDPSDDDQTGGIIRADGRFVSAWGYERTQASNDTDLVFNLDWGYTINPFDFRFQEPLLKVEKTVEPKSVSAGQTVAVTICASSEILGPVSNSDIVDTLPTGWSYVPNTAVLTYPELSQVPLEPATSNGGLTLTWNFSEELNTREQVCVSFDAVADVCQVTQPDITEDWQSNSYTGGSNWIGDWTEVGENNGPGSNQVSLRNNQSSCNEGRLLRFRQGDNRALFRQFSLADFCSPVLTFNYDVNNISGSEEYYVELSTNGTDYTVVRTYDNPTGCEAESIDLSAYADLSSVYLRFRGTNFNSNNDRLYIGDITISDSATPPAFFDNRGSATAEYQGLSFAGTDVERVYLNALRLVLEVDQEQARVGDTLTYTLTLGNTGGTNLTGITLRGPVPAFTSLATGTISDGGTYQSGSKTAVWSGLSLNAGSSLTRTFQAEVNQVPFDQTPVRNQATAVQSSVRVVESNEVETLIRTPIFLLVKKAPGAVSAGGEIAFDFDLYNNGEADGTGVVLTDRIPKEGTDPETDFVVGSVTAPGGATISYSDDNADTFTATPVADGNGVDEDITHIRYDLGTMTAGSLTQIGFRVKVTAGTSDEATIRNFARLTNNETTLRTTNVTETVVTDLQLTLAADRSVVGPRERIAYTLTAANTGGSSFADPVVTQPIPADTIYVGASATEPVGWTLEYSVDGGASYSGTEPADPSTVTHLRWTRTSLAAGASEDLGFVAEVGQFVPAGAVITAQGTISSSDLASVGEVPSNRVDVPTVNVRIVIASDVLVQTPGNPVEYTITVENIGAVPATNVSLEVPGTGFNLFDLTDLQFGSSSPPATETASLVTWNLGDLYPLQPPLVRTFRVDVEGTAPSGASIEALAQAPHDEGIAYSNVAKVLVAGGGVTAGPSAETWGDQDDVLFYPASVTNTGSGDDTFEISATNSNGIGSGDENWPEGSTVRFWRDLDGDGLYDAGLDTLLTNTNGTGGVDTGVLAQGQTIFLLVEITIPSDPPVADGATNVTTVLVESTASSETATFQETTNVLTATAVTLLELTAREVPGGVRVDWVTASEIQNRGFWLERSTARGGPWERVGCCLVPGAIQSSVRQDYSRLDAAAPGAGPLYYRLSDEDMAGRRRTFAPVGVDRDGDGVPFDLELRWGGSDADPDDLVGDRDGDGVRDATEILLGRDPEVVEDAPTDLVRRVDGDVPPPGLRILEQGPEHMVAELFLPGFREETRVVDGVQYRYPELDGVLAGHGEVPGWPRLPLVGLPLPEGFRQVRTERVEARSEVGLPVGPAPRSRAIESGPALGTRPEYQADPSFYQVPPEAYPEAPWELRDTAAGPTLVFLPFTYQHATGTLVFRNRIRVRVELGGASVASGTGVAAHGLSAAEDPGLSALPEGPVLALRTSGPGVYRLNGADLLGAGADPAGHDPRNFALYRGGSPVAMRVVGEEDGVMDGSDFLEFYSPEPGDRHAAGEGYYLLYGASPGARWGERASEAGDAPVIPWYRHSQQEVYREYYFGPIPGGEDMDHWLGGFSRWAYSGQAPVSLPVELDAPAASGNGGKVTVHLASSVETDLDPDHHHRVFFDGTQLSDEVWSGRGFRDAPGYVPAALLAAGTHQVGLQATLDLLPSGVNFDFLMPWGVSLEYDRLFVASADSITFTTAATTARFQVAGFQAAEVVALDISDPDQAIRVTGVAIQGSGPYQAEFGHGASAGRRFHVFAPGSTRTPGDLRVVTRGNLRDPTRRAGWVALCPTGWESSLAALVTRRDAEGLEPAVIPVEQVFDEFSSGVPHPQAIRRFLAYAHENWARAPEYLLLAGDANANPRAYPGSFFTSDPVLVPTPLRTAGRALLRNETPADAWYGRLQGESAAPDVAVGRVHARSAAELTAVSQKIAAYASAPTGSWSEQVVSVADDGEPFFQVNAEEAIDFALPGLSVQRMHQTSFASSADLANALRASLEAGAMLVQFVGHGSSQVWTDDDVLPVGTVTALTNGSQLPVVLSMTCEDGYFGDVFSSTRCLAEEMVMNPNGGAVAYLASGSRTTSEAKDLYHRSVMEALFRKDKRRIGDALREAARTYLANSEDADDLLDGFNLFGDPATEVRIPNPLAPVALSVTRQASGSLLVSWQPVVHPDLSGYQVFRRIGTGESSLVATTNGTSWEDVSAASASGLEAGQAALGATATRYYSVRAVTTSGLGSALHAEVAAAPAASGGASPTPATGGGGGGGGGCQASPGSSRGAGPLGLLLLLPLIALGRRRRLS